MSIKDHPDFLNVIESADIVYLFGAGISAALTGEVYSWRDWIIDGTTFMSDKALAEEYSESVRKNSSADNMIDVVGKVIDALKTNGRYDEWMRAAIEEKKVTNKELCMTLRKLLVSQDIVATTNYDFTLEDATGLSPLSYKRPNDIFEMIERGSCEAVLHIHGLYSTMSGEDSIIASRAQYDALLENKGAQFIQNILGTRTLIFVGCGKTTDDANIAQFIRFAKDSLNMDRTYYFLYKNGESFDGMPENVVPIPYGENYDDLPRFLEQMAQIRVSALISRNAFIGRNIYKNPKIASTSFSRYHYAEESIPFCGRKDEVETLLGFVNSPEKDMLWWAVTGQAGSGKSRLSFELLRRLPMNWFGFFAADDFSENDIKSYKPFSNTLVIIDYVVGREAATANAMRILSEIFEKTPYALRILLTERDNSRDNGSWYTSVKRHLGRYDAVFAKLYKTEFLNLADLKEDFVDEFIGFVCEQKGLLKDRERDKKLRISYAEKFETLKFRPLYVWLFVEAWIDNGCTLPRYDTFEDILKYTLEREGKRLVDAFDGDIACCNAMLRLILRANISGALKLSDIPEYYKKDFNKVNAFIAERTLAGDGRAEFKKSLIGDVCHGIGGGITAIEPLFPDILKEYMFYFYRDEERLEEVMRELWENAAHDLSVFIRRCMSDFPENEFFGKAVNTYKFSENDFDFLAGRLELLKKRDVDEKVDPLVLIKITENEREFWRSVVILEENGERADALAMIKVAGLRLVAMQRGSFAEYDMSPMIDAIEDMLEVKCGKATEFIKQQALHDFIKELSVNGFFGESEYLRQKQEELIKNSEQNEWTALLHMHDRNDEMMKYIINGNFYQAKETLKMMNNECDRDYLESVRSLAHSCFNLDHLAFMARQMRFIGRGLEIVKTLEERYPDDRIVRARALGCRAVSLQHRYFDGENESENEIRAEFDSLEKELCSIAFLGNADDDEALGMSWGTLKTFKINFIKDDAEAMAELISEADAVIAVNPRISEVVTTKIQATRALHINALHNKVTSAEVEDAFRLVELSFDSESVREAFFEMLEDSEEAHNRRRYMTRKVVAGAVQTAKYNPISGSGIDEIDDVFDMMRASSSLYENETYRRAHKKIGANDPCPCGSGKKFKKCCRGNGKYD